MHHLTGTLAAQPHHPDGLTLLKGHENRPVDQSPTPFIV
ncbi:hypothetical protein AF71_00054280 [Rhizobium sp. 57MFTsu3.2]|jgi:hypothetical protein|nr:hypothetical protein [Rhizobium sp. 57MFTsu3.2]